MSKKYFIFYLLTISFLFTIISSKLDVVESDIAITSSLQSKEITHQDNIHLFSATFDKSEGKFIFLEIVPKDYVNEYNHIFVSIPGAEGKVPTYKDSDYKTVDKNTTLLIETNNIQTGVTSAKIAIECKNSCDFIFYYQLVTTIPLINDRSFDLILNPNEEFVMEFEPESIDDLNNKFTFFSNAPSDFDLKIIYKDTENIQPLTEFYNGYGLFIDKDTYPDGGKFIFKLSHYGKPNELVHVSNRKLTKEIKSLSVGDFHNSITGIPNLEKECFNLPKIAETEKDKNYNLNFLTYTKNILITFDSTDTFVINSESDLIQIDAKKYSEMCFSSNNGQIATTTFQLLDGTEQTLNQDMQMPLYRGMPKKAKLLKGQIAYYRLYFYLPYSEKLVMNLKSVEGKAKLYYGVCSNYPNCNFQEDQLSQLETEKDINNNIFIKKTINEDMKKPYSDPEFQVAVVYCTNEENEKDCEYFITLSNDNDEINIIENQKYYSSVKNLQLNKFQFNIYDSKNELEYLVIKLYSFSGQGVLTIYSDKEMSKEITSVNINSVQNSEVATITASSLQNKTLHGNYYVKVRGLTNTVYSIYYFTLNSKGNIEDNYLISNEVNIQTLKLDGKERSFFIKNKATHKNTPFIFEYNSLNCELEVSLVGETETIKERNHQFLIDSSKSYYKEDYYQMKIVAKNADIDGATSDMMCLISLFGGEIEQNKEIVLSDGVIQTGKLTKSINYINYLYAFILNSFDDDVTLFLQKDSSYTVDLSYSFGNSDLITHKVINSDKRLVFTKNDFNEQCSKHVDESCILKIQVKIDEKETLTDDSDVNFILSVNNKVTYPSYLPKDQLVKNVLQTNQYQYYYLEIGKNEECDIFLDFNEGFGQAIAKLVKKDEIEENANYNRRVLLPLPGMPENYVFDQYKKQLNITKDMTSKCDKGCEIYVAIFHTDQRYRDLISSYNIYYRKNNNIVNLPENTIGHGNLKTIQDTNIFKTKINKKTGFIAFNVIGEHIYVYINKGETIPTPDSRTYYIDSEKDKQLIIKDDSFEGDIFTYVVMTDKLEGQKLRNYDIKIDTFDSETVNIQLIDYLHNNPCYFNKDKQKCHYMLPVDNYNNEDKLYLFSPENKNVLIYANLIPMEEFDKLTPEEKASKLPTKSDDSKDYLIIDISGRKKETDYLKKEIYVLITVETTELQKESITDIVVGGYYHPSTTILRPNAYSFYSVKYIDEHNYSLNLAFEAEGLYKISFVLLSEYRGNITQSQVNKVFEFSQNNNNNILTFLFDPELKKQTIFTVEFNSKENELCFYAYLEYRSSVTNINEIKYANILEQKFEYLGNEQIKNFFPLSFYEIIPENTKEDKQFIFQIFDRVPSEEKFKNKNITVEGCILNKTSIEDIKLNKQNVMEESIISFGEYDNILFTARITFTKEIIEKYAIYDHNYFYINIKDNNVEEEDVFEYVEIDILKSKFNFMDINKYTTHKIQEKETKNLLLVPKMETSKMALEFFFDGKSSLNDFDVSFNIYNNDDENYSKNSTILIDYQDTKRSYQKQLGLLYINDQIHYIVVNIIKNDYDKDRDNNINYFFKYRVQASDPGHYYLSSERNIENEIDNHILKMNYNPIRECQSGCTYHQDFIVKYVAKFYDKEKINMDSIGSILVDEEPLYENTLIKKGDEKEKINWEFEIKENDGKEQIVQIIGYASYEDNEEIFIYNSFKIKYEKVITDRTFEFWIILFSFVGIVIITFGVMYVYIYAKIEIGRRTLMMNNINNTNISLIQRPSDRTSGNTNTRTTV